MPTVGDVTVVHPGAASYVRAAARTTGAAMAVRDAEKTGTYATHGGGGYTFVPMGATRLSPWPWSRGAAWGRRR